MASSPFSASGSRAGHGEIHLSLLPPSTPSFRTLAFTYPLKIVSSTPHTLSPTPAPTDKTPDDAIPSTETQGRTVHPSRVPLLFLLSYGGGLLPPDSLSVNITLDPGTRLTLTTQGSTKVFPSPSSIPATATQTLHAYISSHGALLLSPDPVQPFAASHYAQTQIFTLASETASLCVLDWVVEGRRARGEHWVAGSWRGRNEVWREYEAPSDSTAIPKKRVLMIRDAVILSGGPNGPGQASLRHEGIGVFGTMILIGPIFNALGSFFIEEFAALPRIGARDWGDGAETDEGSDEEKRRLAWRRRRVQLEKRENVLWTAARVRGAVLVKFGAREVQGARSWLREMWYFEGTVGREFGDGGMMSLR